MTSSRIPLTYLKNLKPRPANAKSTDYEVNLFAMKGRGLPTVFAALSVSLVTNGPYFAIAV